MALIQSQAKAPGTGGRAQFVGLALTVAVLIVAAAMVAVLASSLTAKSTGGSVTTTKADPFVEQNAIQFRAAERAAGAAAVDPFVQQNAIQFRANEHAAAGALIIQGRRPGEHPAGVVQGDRTIGGSSDPFLQPGAIQFRLDEHPPADPLLTQSAPARMLPSGHLDDWPTTNVRGK
jgi:hypothetical protein